MSVKPTNIPKCHLRKSADSAGNISRHCKLGELTENIRTFALPFENQTYTFKMQYEYDSWNRIQNITYPDGEKVSYDYNRGGMLESVIGDKNGDTYKYIGEIRYNPFEQKETVVYGNGAVTSYSYDVLLRLSHLRSVCADGTMQDIDYDYDEVSNISKIVNYAGMLPTGLGGTYDSQFSYDNLYRLISANGEWHGNNDLYYETSMDYEANGRISRKVLYADTWLDGNYATENYDNEYYYVNSGQPNTLSTINEDQQSFEWDLKGNMVFHYNGHSGYNRSLCWDEQNRLLGVKDDEQRLSYYLYDANGDRTCKFTGEYTVQNQSGQWHYYYLLNCPTLYASPYLVTSKKGYTKHYYAESERIASRIGGGGLEDLHKGMEEYPELASRLKEKSSNHFGKVMECLDADAMHEEDALIYLYEWQELVAEEPDCYWYHPDHLGSSSWITFSDGSAVQHLHYLPWGEDFVDQRSTSWNAMYTFSAKEKDTETGYSYFGSRYYNSDLSIWLSVDPLSDKYPSMSPYVYCANNPVKLVDPNGEEIGDYYSYNGKWLGTDGVNDNKAYVATEKNPNGTFKNAKELPISNSELLDRATWVCGESGGSNEQITSRIHNVGDPTSTSDAGVADYYAFAINNASKADGGFYKAVFNRMGKIIDGKYTRTSEGYFEGRGLGGNTNSKAFAKARASGMSSINADSRFTNSIAAVIKSVLSPQDPTGGCRAWLGGSSAEKYYNNAKIIYNNGKKKAVMQFSFTSNNKAFYHTFYRF